MLRLFRIRDHDGKPAELLRYCEKRKLPVLGILSMIAYMSRDLAHHTNAAISDANRSPEERAAAKLVRVGQIGLNYFCYLFAYASWIGRCKKNLDFDDRSRSEAKDLPPPEYFSNGGSSQRLSDFIRMFFSEGQVAANLSRADQYYGCFRTATDVRILSTCVRAALMQSFLWSRWGWSDEKHQAYIGTINEKLHFPRAFYDEEAPDLRTFWNLALLAEIYINYGEWDPITAGARWSHLFVLLSGATNGIRTLMLESEFPEVPNPI